MEKFSERFARLISGKFVESHMTPAKLGRHPKGRNVKPVVRTGIDDEPNRVPSPFRREIPKYIFASDHLAAGICRVPVITLANQDQGRNGHNSLKEAAGWIERGCRTKLVFRCPFNFTTFNS